MEIKKYIDLNYLLRFAHLIVVVFALFVYKDNNDYVNSDTILLLIAFSLVNQLILILEKKYSDPFIMVLMINTFLFYIVRILTLTISPWSVALSRFPFSPEQLNSSIIFIMIANIAIVSGLIVAKRKKVSDIQSESTLPASPGPIFIILLISLFLNFSTVLKVGLLSRLAGFINSYFINIQLLLLFTVIYLFVGYKHIGKMYRFILINLIMVYIILITLTGSRSALLTINIFILIGLLVVFQRIKLNTKILVIIPIIIVGSVVLFLIATHIRKQDIERLIISTKQLDIVKNYSIDNSNDNKDLFEELKTKLSPVFDRAGYLDYTAGIISNNEKYSKVINVEYYYKSFIDNVISPGFNIFNAPKVSNALRGVYAGFSEFTYKELSVAYQSDMLTLYGEYYVMFAGYFSIFVMFIFSLIFQRIYLSIKCRDIYIKYIYRALLLFVYYTWINSFGMDWLIADLVSVLITIILFQGFYKMRIINANNEICGVNNR